MKRKLLIILMAVGSLAGCASGPSFQEYSAKIAAIPETQGRIYVYRKTAFGAAIQPKVWLNDQVVGKAVPQGFFFIDRPPGKYELRTSTEATRILKFNLQPGEEKYVRLEIKLGIFAGHVKPVLVDDDVGKVEISKTKFVDGG